MSVKMDPAVGMQPPAVATQEAAAKQAAGTPVTTTSTDSSSTDEKAVVSKIEPKTVLRAEIFALQRRQAVINRGVGEVSTIGAQLDRVEMTLIELRSVAGQVGDSEAGASRIELTIQYTSIQTRLQGLEGKTQFPGPRLDKALEGLVNRVFFEEENGEVFESSAPAAAPHVRTAQLFGQYLGLTQGGVGELSGASFARDRIDDALDHLASLREQYSTLGDRLASRLEEIGAELAAKREDSGTPLEPSKASALALQVQAQLSEFPGIAKAAQSVAASRAATLLAPFSPPPTDSLKEPKLETPTQLASELEGLRAKQDHRERQLGRASAARSAAVEMTSLLKKMFDQSARVASGSIGSAERSESAGDIRRLFEQAANLAAETKFLSSNLVSILGDRGAYLGEVRGADDYYNPGPTDLEDLLVFGSESSRTLVTDSASVETARHTLGHLDSSIYAAGRLVEAASQVEEALAEAIREGEVRIANLEAAQIQPDELAEAITRTQGAGSPPVAPSLAAQLAQVNLSLPPIVLELDE